MLQRWMIAALLILAGKASADPLLGEAKMALATAEGASANPANAAALPRSEAAMHANAYKNDSLRIRYPGFPSVNESDSGLGLPTSIPSFIYKATPDLGLGGFAAPALPITLPIEKKNIPIMLLGTLNFVDIVAEGKLEGAAAFTAGYRLTNRFAIGLNFNYLSISAVASLSPSEGGGSLADITLTRTTVTTGAGIRFEVVPGKLVLGFASDVFNQSSQDLVIQSELMPQAGQPKTNFSVANPLDAFKVGIGALMGRSLKLYLDVEYNRADQGATDFSFVDLTEKPVDTHDTMAVRMGAVLRTDSGREFLFGGRYEPASIGPGAPGDDGTVGFGTMNVINMFVLGENLQPFWQVAGGMRAHFSPERIGRGKKARRYFKWTLGGGLSYQRASLGIDENGELPGAYLQTKLNVPVSITYRF